MSESGLCPFELFAGRSGTLQGSSVKAARGGGADPPGRRARQNGVAERARRHGRVRMHFWKKSCGPATARRTPSSTLAVEDLYLAFACSRGRHARRCARSSARWQGELDAAFAKLRVAPARRDDARQQLWEKLFVGPPRPRILDYSGRGRLKLLVPGDRAARAARRRCARQKRSVEVLGRGHRAGRAVDRTRPGDRAPQAPVPQAGRRRVRGDGERAAAPRIATCCAATTRRR